MHPSSRFTTHRADRARGFTLVEIMVVIVILGMLATLVIPSVISTTDTANATKAQADVHSIAGAVRLYYAQNGRLPALPELAAPDAKNHIHLENLPNDPWHHPYVLRDGAEARDFEVVSPGRNGNLGDGDDISSRAVN